MNILKRNLAPLTDEAWEAIDQQARAVLEANLAARRFVDVHGPHGWDYSAVNLGRLDEPRNDGRVGWGQRQVQPLVEFRVRFELGRWELDNLARGASDVHLEAVRAAALEGARFEERVVYRGLPGTAIDGLVAASTNDTLPLPEEAHEMPAAVTNAIIRLTDAGVDGPYLLVLGERAYKAVGGDANGYPLRKQLASLVGEVPVYSPGLDGALLVSTRGGDFCLSLGADLSIGYDHTEGDTVHLYITESFAFRVNGPEAVVVLQHAA
jgi:uncharacterized linocin/CFP29 family protein